jgi:hypothetical protein
MLGCREGSAGVQLSNTTWWVTGGRGCGWGRTTELLTLGVGFDWHWDLPEPMALHNVIRVDDTHIMFVGGAV